MKALITTNIIRALCAVALCAVIGVGCGENTQNSPLSSASDAFESAANNEPELQPVPESPDNTIVAAASASVGSCGVVRVDVRNSTEYTITVELVGHGIRKKLTPGQWLNELVWSNQNVTIRATYLAYSTTQTFSANGDCNVRTRVVRLSPGIIRLEQITVQS